MKNEIIMGILLSGILGASIGFVIPAVKFENLHIIEEKKQESNLMNYTDFTSLIAARKNVCEECHLSGKKYIPQAYEVTKHVNGGAYCLVCHKISHTQHPVNDSVTCIACHGETAPKIPTRGDEKILCNNCHGFPDPLLPGNGNLILIHEPRGIGCIDCHRINHLNAFS